MIFDIIVLIIVLVIFSMVTIFGWKIFSEINGDIQTDLSSDESIEAMQEIETRYPTVMDGFILIIFAGLWIAGIAAALMSESHPMIFGLMIFLIVFVLISAAILANYFEETYQDPELNTMVSSFPKTNWVITHLLELSVMVALSIMLALMGKNRL